MYLKMYAFPSSPVCRMLSLIEAHDLLNILEFGSQSNTGLDSDGLRLLEVIIQDDELVPWIELIEDHITSLWTNPTGTMQKAWLANLEVFKKEVLRQAMLKQLHFA